MEPRYFLLRSYRDSQLQVPCKLLGPQISPKYLALVGVKRMSFPECHTYCKHFSLAKDAIFEFDRLEVCPRSKGRYFWKFPSRLWVGVFVDVMLVIEDSAAGPAEVA